MTVGDWVQVSVTVVLVCITGWYAWETRRIVKNMERDREEMHCPVLSFQLVPWDGVNIKLRIQNIGAGAAFNIEGDVTSENKIGSDSFPWSYSLLPAGKYEEFGLPAPKGAEAIERFRFEKIRERVTKVEAKFKYRSSSGVNYELNESIEIGKITSDWIASRMLVTQDHPDRIMPRIAKTLEGIEKALKNHNH